MAEGDIFVSLVMAIGVVYRFETVNVAHNEADGKELVLLIDSVQ